MSEGWETATWKDEDGRVFEQHVLPIGEQHEEYPNCPCNPTYDSETLTYVHHSYDFRELIEEAERIKDSSSQ